MQRPAFPSGRLGVRSTTGSPEHDALLFLPSGLLGVGLAAFRALGRRRGRLPARLLPAGTGSASPSHLRRRVRESGQLRLLELLREPATRHAGHLQLVGEGGLPSVLLGTLRRAHLRPCGTHPDLLCLDGVDVGVVGVMVRGVELLAGLDEKVAHKLEGLFGADSAHLHQSLAQHGHDLVDQILQHRRRHSILVRRARSSVGCEGTLL
mmetsp:Transcript_26665/g.67086  ORF Transcript_26665/g.67086 Transcript_26665/m.67086 type:complete len:208 (+) Transcript_26665:50-673(+)